MSYFFLQLSGRISIFVWPRIVYIHLYDVTFRFSCPQLSKLRHSCPTVEKLLFSSILSFSENFLLYRTPYLAPVGLKQYVASAAQGLVP